MGRTVTEHNVYKRKAAELGKIERQNPWVTTINLEVSKRGLRDATEEENWVVVAELAQTLKLVTHYRKLAEQVQACSESYNAADAMVREFFPEEFEG